MKSVGVVGLGKLGICLLVLFSKHFKVYGVDVNEKRIKQIRSHNQFFEPQVNEYLAKYGNNLTMSTDYNILENRNVVFIITQTPSTVNGLFNTEYVESALRRLHAVNPHCLVVVSSTVNIGTLDKLSKIHNRVCYNPEFVKQGTIIKDFEEPKFVFVGAYSDKDGQAVADIWREVHNKPIYVTQPVEAEICKLALNFTFTLGITFANMIGELCEKFGADSSKVLDVIYRDRRNYKQGLGFMGPCFCRDVDCFNATCKQHSVESGSKFADLLNTLNDGTLQKYVSQIKSFGKKSIGILGVSYKPNVPYIYESQPLKIAEQLSKEGYEIFIHDPLAEDNAKKVLPRNTHFCSTIEECVEHSEVIFVGTKNFSHIKPSKPTVNPWK